MIRGSPVAVQSCQQVVARSALHDSGMGRTTGLFLQARVENTAWRCGPLGMPTPQWQKLLWERRIWRSMPDGFLSQICLRFAWTVHPILQGCRVPVVVFPPPLWTRKMKSIELTQHTTAFQTSFSDQTPTKHRFKRFSLVMPVMRESCRSLTTLSGKQMLCGYKRADIKEERWAVML